MTGIEKLQAGEWCHVMFDGTFVYVNGERVGHKSDSRLSFMRWAGGLVVLCMLVVGCNQPAPPPEPEGLAELKACLAGFRRESMESSAEVRNTLQDHTDSLRAIRDAVESPVEVPGDAGRPDEPQEVEQLSPPAATTAQQQFYLVMWTKRGCPPCARWKAQEKAYLENAGFEVVLIDVDQQPGKARQYGVTSYPSFEWCDRNTRKVVGKRFVGYRTARQLELALGEPQTSTPAKVQTPSPIITRPDWGTVDLRTYSNPGCNCAMCQGIRALQRQHGYPVKEYQGQTRPRRRTWFRTSVQPAQEPVSEPEMLQAIALANLKESDVFADIGCGDGRVLIEAHLRSGCRCVGIEIDPEQAERAKVNVRNAGLAEHIDIIEGDARQFRPADHGVTVAYAYLYPDLLAELRPMLETIPRLVTPWHPVDGMDGEQHGNVWVYRG
jgi:hypothetical protein